VNKWMARVVLIANPEARFIHFPSVEMEVLECVVKGKSNKEIAGLLGISHQTVKKSCDLDFAEIRRGGSYAGCCLCLKHGWVQLKNAEKNSGNKV